MDKRFWGILLVIGAVLGGVFFLTSSQQAGAPGGTPGGLTNHVKGSTSSGVKLVEYGDFQCPACAQYYPVVEQVAEKYKDQIQFQFRNYPLFQIHQNAIAAARAAEAADLQGKYFEMYNLLYQNQQSWAQSSNPNGIFEGYARQIGLDGAKYATDFKSRTTNDRVQADLKEGNRLEVSSTPTFFLDGKKLENTQLTVEAFSKAIDAAIADRKR